ncbi:MAG: phospholipid phosphatase, partial [Synechococcus sp.]|nr:phospholipid phosphatase [Synechococcus sp.]
IAFPKYGDILGIFCGFLPIPTSQWQPPPKIGSKIGLGLSSLVIVGLSYVFLKTVSQVFPEVALVDYGRALAIALIVTEGIPRLWQRRQPVR